MECCYRVKNCSINLVVVHKQSGFSLLELLVVLVLLGILYSYALNNTQSSLIDEGRLVSSHAWLQTIAVANRLYFDRKGEYLSTLDEKDIEEKLGVKVGNSGDYCYAIRSGDGNYLSSSGNGTALFEVWAVLRDRNYTMGSSSRDTVGIYQGGVLGVGGLSCTTSEEKIEATGWVLSDTTIPLSEGRVVVYRYPPPDKPWDDTVRTGRSNVRLSWNGSVSHSDATQ